MPISDVLLSRAADLDADLIVAGAYHHSQFREALLGGGQPRTARTHDRAGADVALKERNTSPRRDTKVAAKDAKVAPTASCPS